jgi:hypothetical protein
MPTPRLRIASQKFGGNDPVFGGLIADSGDRRTVHVISTITEDQLISEYFIFNPFHNSNLHTIPQTKNPTIGGA